MPIETYLTLVIEPLLGKPQALKIETTSDEMGVLFTLTLDKEDMGMVIGRAGETAKSIRHLLRVYGMKQQARVSIKINEPDGSAYRPRQHTEVTDKELIGI